MQKYRIKQKDGKWHLKIWEPAERTKDRSLPFLFKIQKQFETEEEAIAELEFFARMNGGMPQQTGLGDAIPSGE